MRGAAGGEEEGGASNIMRFDEWILALWVVIRHAEPWQSQGRRKRDARISQGLIIRLMVRKDTREKDEQNK